MAIEKFDPAEINWDAEFIVYGEPASKANSRKIVKFGNRPASIKSDKARTYLTTFGLFCPLLKPLLEGDILVAIEIFYFSRRPDLDESLILDAMEGLIYKNDRQVKRKFIYHNLDKINPRAEIKIARL